MRPEGVFTPSPVTFVGALVLGGVDFLAVLCAKRTAANARRIVIAARYLVMLISLPVFSKTILKHRGAQRYTGVSDFLRVSKHCAEGAYRYYFYFSQASAITSIST